MSSAEAVTFIWVWDCACGLGGWYDAFVPLGVNARRLDAVLAALGMCSSVSDAQRMVKGGGVSTRTWGEWKRAEDPREKIPEGWPVVIRVGNGLWRLTKRTDGRPGYQLWPGIETVMIPVEQQSIEAWSEIWRLPVTQTTTEVR